MSRTESVVRSMSGSPQRNLRDLDLAGRQVSTGSSPAFASMFLDLAAVAGAVEVDEDTGDAGGGERVEQSRLVGRQREFVSRARMNARSFSRKSLGIEGPGSGSDCYRT